MTKRSGVDQLDSANVVKNALVLSNINLREKLAIRIFVVFSGTVALTYTLIFLWGFKIIALPGAFVHWLGGATVGQTAGMLTLILRDLFPGGKRSGTSGREKAQERPNKTQERS